MRVVLVAIFPVALFACAETPEAATPEEATPAASLHPDQIAEGKHLYQKNCAKCHGDSGQGTNDAPPVVGKQALPRDPPAAAKERTARFQTAKDVLDFVKASMPADRPGTLTDHEYAAIVAFDLRANGVDVSNTQVDTSTAPNIVLHP